MYPPDDESYRPIAASRTLFLDGVDTRAAQTMLDHLKQATAMMAVVQLRALGGAMARVPAEATAFAHRGQRVMANVAALVQRLDEVPGQQVWADGLAEALAGPEPPAYVNFVADDSPARVRAAYPGGTWDRLVEIKRRYDPENLFRKNHNVRG
jgi:hypothetical protein